MKYILTISILIITISINAEVITDGTLGQNINLSGPDFQITPDLGQQHGGNLFHSFQDFNLNSLESAMFSGPNNVQNIISRVTGGNPSNIDGLIRSTIPNADFYFLNPYGIMFGSNAKLDVQGSFHASTADYLRLGENGRFDARNPSDSLLTVAPVTAFGFLNDSPSSIEITNSSLQVLPTKTLSLTGGDINLTNTQPTTYDETSRHIFTNQLSAPSGLIIIDAKGTINLTNFGIDTSGLFGGQIDIHGKKLGMNASRISSHTIGKLDGQAINIQVDNLFMQDSDIIANTYGAGHGSLINMQITEDLIGTRLDRPLGILSDIKSRGSSHISTVTIGESIIGIAGDIRIQADNIYLHNAATISSDSFSNAKSGNISLKITDTFQASDTIALNNKVLPIISSAMTLSFGDGDSGNIDINAKYIRLDNGGNINTTTWGNGRGGDISIQANTILVKDQDKVTGMPTAIASISQNIGQAGQININADRIILEDGGTISNNSFYSGKANKIVVTVSDTLTISGVAKLPYGMLGFPKLPYPSNISSASPNINAEGGQASDIYVKAKYLTLENGGIISSLTYGGGNAGNAEVIADTIRISGWNNNGILYRSGINNSSTNPASYAGFAGNIDVTANKIMISDGGAINTSAMNAGGGNIKINAKDMIYLDTKGSITTSVHSGIGGGGNIEIANPRFTVLNQGQITAQADAGHGGNIRIVADQFITSPNSLISASSNLGLDGDVNVESLDVDLTGALKAFGINFLNAAAHMRRPCTIEDIMEPDTFYVFHLTGSEPSPTDFIANELVLIEEEEDVDLKAEVKENKPVDWTGCRPKLLAGNI